MRYSVKLTESNLVLSANSSKVFFEEFSKLPAGEYTVSILSGTSRSGKHHRKISTVRVMSVVSILLEVATIILVLGCISLLWIIGCALA